VIHWGEPRLLWLLALVPALALLLALGVWLKRRALRQLADPILVPRLTDSRSPRWAAARPQWGEKLQVVKGHGIDVVIALDASRSMLATDIPPSRLERAKVQIGSLLDNLSGNRVGIVAFAGSAQVMCPLTTDVEAAKLFLEIIDPGNMPKPGTNIQSAVEAAASLFGPSEDASKALILITDGDNLDGDPSTATRVALDNHIRLFAVGVATPEGSTVPEAGATGTSYEKDENGKIVMSRLGERLLLVMAKATDGRYFRSESINLDALIAALDQVQKKSISGGEYVEYEERYQSFLLAAFLLLFAGTLISDRRGAWFPDSLRPLRTFAGWFVRRRRASRRCWWWRGSSLRRGRTPTWARACAAGSRSKPRASSPTRRRPTRKRSCSSPTTSASATISAACNTARASTPTPPTTSSSGSSPSRRRCAPTRSTISRTPTSSRASWTTRSAPTRWR
jgi:Ca-activated chloride channel family protein